MHKTSFPSNRNRWKEQTQALNSRKAVPPFNVLTNPLPYESDTKKQNTITDKPSNRWKPFYADDFIAYKKEVGNHQHTREFLHILSSHFTDNFKKHQQTSWYDCLFPFWEELIMTHFLNHLYISKERNESIIFLTELKKFIRWLDQQIGTSWYETMKRYTKQAATILIYCENLLNHLFLLEYPSLYRKHSLIKKELSQNMEKINQLDAFHASIFQVNEIADTFISITDIQTKENYKITGKLSSILQGDTLLHGGIGKKKERNLLWEWVLTEGVYPYQAKKYLLTS